MKKKYFIILILILIVIILGVILIGVKKLNNKDIDKEVLKNEDNQVTALVDIYNDFFNSFNMEEHNIYLDKSCYKNLITGEEFTQENKEILKQFEKEKAENTFENIIYISYNSDDDIITIEMNSKVINSDNNSSSHKQRYKLYTNDNKITFERYLFLETETMDYVSCN